jgi:hypothetical protein
MQDFQPPNRSDLLSICALLRWFDRDRLGALTGANEAEIEALMLSDMVTLAAAPRGAYQLREDIRADALARLRADRPSDESTWHWRIFGYFLRRMQESASDQQRSVNEEAVLYHLGELFLVIAARQEWHLFAEYIAAIRADAYQARLERWFAFYDGFAAMRTQNYARSLEILSELYNQPNLEPGLRVQVMNALGQLLWFQSHFDRALDLYRQTYDLATEIGDQFYQGVA